MQRVELTHTSQVERQGHTSKGDQSKWQVGETWYKADHMGYEGLSEVVVTRMLQMSTISNFVVYKPVKIQVEGKLIPGCVSQNFQGKAERLIPLERLHRISSGDGLAKIIAKLSSVEDRLQYTVNFVKQVTGLEGFGRYLATIMELDAFLLNEDRHTNNLAVIRDNNTKKFRLCPLFDHGLSLLSDTTSYPLAQNIYALIDRVKAKPFSVDFQEQAEAATGLYGSDLHFNFKKKDIPSLLDRLDELYNSKVLARVEQVIREQTRKYNYLFPTG